MFRVCRPTGPTGADLLLRKWAVARALFLSKDKARAAGAEFVRGDVTVPLWEASLELIGVDARDSGCMTQTV